MCCTGEKADSHHCFGHDKHILEVFNTLTPKNKFIQHTCLETLLNVIKGEGPSVSNL